MQYLAPYCFETAGKSIMRKNIVYMYKLLALSW